MPVVVADTSPINYLVQIDAIELLPKLFGRITISAAVQGLLDALLAQHAERKK
jgi:predicted nucleic acid-binding protein